MCISALPEDTYLAGPPISLTTRNVSATTDSFGCILCKKGVSASILGLAKRELGSLAWAQLRWLIKIIFAFSCYSAEDSIGLRKTQVEECDFLQLAPDLKAKSSEMKSLETKTIYDANKTIFLECFFKFHHTGAVTTDPAANLKLMFDLSSRGSYWAFMF